MLEKIDEKLESEVNKLLEKNELTIEEIKFLVGERDKFQAIKNAEELKLKQEQNKEYYTELFTHLVSM